MQMKNTPSKTIVIVGPTASGKSDLAILLAQKYDGEIISADSRQIYRGMDLGSGKVVRDLPEISNFQFLISKQKKKVYLSEGVVHHLLDVASPKRSYNVTHFVRDAKKVLANIRKRNKTPIICGGTGFWVQALIENNIFPPVKPNTKLRKLLRNKSAEELFAMLEKKDPKRASTIESQNKVRLIRALEICETLGTVPQAINSQQLTVNSKNYLIIALNPSKEILQKNIERRLEKRLRKGMVQEVEKLRESGLSWKRLESFGLEYRNIALFLQEKISREAMKENILRESRHYVKRQLTWLRRFEKMGAHIHWINNEKEMDRIFKTLHLPKKMERVRES
jgi:tRNA dimethylallyltransferase